SALMPNLKSSIPYLSRRDNERHRDQANKQIEKFYEIFKDMSFEISFTDALILMPKFASTLKALIGNKEKLSEMARTSINEHYSAVILNKLPRKLGDPDKFLIPCEFSGLDECSALADLDRSVSKPIGIAKDVSVKVDITVSGNSTPYDDPIVSITSPTLTLFGDNDFLLFVEADAFLGLEGDPNSPEFNPFYYDPKGDILLLEAILNTKTIKSSVNEPPEVELKDLPPHLEYAFLEGDNKFPVIIAKELGDEEKSALIKGGFTIVENEENELIPTHLVTRWRTMEVFMDDFSVFRNSFEDCLSRLDKMLQRCEDTNLCLNWEKSHFMVKEGIVLGHKISKKEIEVDKAKVDVIAKLPHPTTVK
nr:reverse transcriptase domain-containing protein [Tanacetum cinerariifolium]